MLKTLLCVSAFVLIGVSAKVGEVCQDVSTCDDGECCLHHFSMFSVSKLGTCQKYVKEGESCDEQAMWRGKSCTCEEGLACYSQSQGSTKTAVCEELRH
ncbi:uncharacterized protein LOC106012792 [Aplysia californica]|uniref:Uncharacterized protein LOC106012792 n=1 Tax=Aplysia californica TaxID=6500 RepID=A0ABM1A7A8_APLCA|nr:uncharacterized protein LOC106012792 [Aplysia californica]